MQQSSYNNYDDYIMIIAIQCWKLFSAQAVVLAVLVEVILSANLGQLLLASEGKVTGSSRQQVWLISARRRAFEFGVWL